MHLTFEGPKPKTKAQKKTQGKIHAREIETRIPYAQQKAGGDAGLSTFALVSDYDAKFIELYPEHAREDKHKKALQQAIERSIRANNPDNYNADGTYKKRFERKPWKISNRQRKLRQKYKDKCRKVRIRCQESHRKNANDLAAAAGKMLIEPMHWQGMAKHSSKPTEINEKTGKCKRKRRFGRSITQKAPARFIKYLKEAIQLQGGTVEEVNSHKVKATQYNPATGEYKKHTILERWIELPLFKIFVQRDLLSAYNLKCVDEGLQSAETPESWKGLDNFIKMHDKLISELLKSPKLTKRLFWYIRRRPEFN